MAVRGRWMVWVSPSSGDRVMDDDPQVAVQVPAVPCDDAAVKRATLVLYESVNRDQRAPHDIGWYAETAAAVLRAAGGQDAS